jgi:aspartyl/asparaginyl beta-hydroxylase (cupin superfamily)
VFDDTIEHEAWNDADLPRATLMLDVWNPLLTPLVRDLVREMTQGGKRQRLHGDLKQQLAAPAQGGGPIFPALHPSP